MNNIKDLYDRINKLEEALIWCSGSADFSPGGTARSGWIKLCQPLLQNLYFTKCSNLRSRFKNIFNRYFKV